MLCLDSASACGTNHVMLVITMVHIQFKEPRTLHKKCYREQETHGMQHLEMVTKPFLHEY